ncbi:hypothetical protein PybrP1_003788 [[Pythium] brassicae (nom. inval.)]|nr:hypothetical protein PybrP1_003788 [[Pythium] brassicae (nom. inval.)]
MGLGSSKQSTNDDSDLREEQVEEIRMLTSDLRESATRPIIQDTGALGAEHHHFRRAFGFSLRCDAAKRPKKHGHLLTSSPFGAVGVCQVRVHVQLPQLARRQAARSKAFRIHDFDGDGRISRTDLRAYLEIVYPNVSAGAAETEIAAEDTDLSRNEVRLCKQRCCRRRQEDTNPLLHVPILQELELLVSRVMEEASSDPAMEVLQYEDFAKVVQATDFESRLVLPF